MLKKTRLGLSDVLSFGNMDLSTLIKLITFISRSCLKESILNPLNGLKFILPGKYTKPSMVSGS